MVIDNEAARDRARPDSLIDRCHRADKKRVGEYLNESRPVEKRARLR